MTQLRNSIRWIATVTLAIASVQAHAHTGHETSSLYDGLVHPFGPDHLLAMVAVGIWSICALPRDRAWWGPATFMLALLVSAVLGHAGFHPPYLEHAIALSVVVFGVMLLLARKGFPSTLGLTLIALAASMHGLAHGAETPETGFAGYAIGFLATTAALHFGGILCGLAIQRWLDSQRAQWTLGGLGTAFAVAGVYLFGQLSA